MKSPLVVLVVLVTILSLAAGEKSRYRIVDRMERKARRTAVNAEEISFSGDLAPIIDLATQLAQEEAEATEEPGPVSGGSGGGGTDEEDTPPPQSTIIGCADDTSNSTFVTFTYEMEVMPEAAQQSSREAMTKQPTVQELLEQALNEALAESLLTCSGVLRRRRLDDRADVGIVQFDSLPLDDEVWECSPRNPANTCKTLEGSMQVWYDQGSDREIVEYKVLTATKNFLNTVKDPTVPYLARAEYKGPDLSDPTSASDGDQTPAGEQASASGGNLSVRSIIFMSVASVGFVAIVGLVTYFRMRKAARDDEVPFVATLENESSAEESHSRSGEELSNSSSLTSILPTAYRIDSPFSSIATSIAGGSSMGTIHETDDARSDGILISDNGYSSTDESSGEYPFFENSYMPTPAPVLGARPRTEEELEDSP